MSAGANPRASGGSRPAWQLDDVAFRHAGAVAPALDGVSAEIPLGRCTAVIGPNGAGKSTLLSLVLGGARPARGTVRFLGRAIDAWPRAELARRVGVVPQEEATDFPLTVRALVAMGRYPHLGAWGRERPADRAAVDAALARCELAALADRPLARLSGGERQRARLARALAQIAMANDDATERALVLDEPTRALDIAHEMAFFRLARELARGGITVLLVTHHLNLSARYADHLLLLHEGRLAAAGAPDDVLTSATVSRVYGWPVAVFPYQGPAVGRGSPQVVPLDQTVASPLGHDDSSRGPRPAPQLTPSPCALT